MSVGVFLRVCLVATAISGQTFGSEPSFPRSLESDSVESLFQLSTNVYSGGQPHGQDAFQQLRELGIKTVISVDGAKPDVVSARKEGLRYIHLPVGYGRWSRKNQLRLIAAANIARESGPVFVHCHHGRHRGPAAAALICMGLDNWDEAQGDRWLGIAGTGTNYHGLFENLAQFIPPTEEMLAQAGTEFPESVEPSGMVESMVQMDLMLENLELLTSNGDLDVAHIQSESLLLLEALRELGRLPDIQSKDITFTKELEFTQNAARDALEISKGDEADMAAALKKIRQSCSSCHRKFRD